MCIYAYTAWSTSNGTEIYIPFEQIGRETGTDSTTKFNDIFKFLEDGIMLFKLRELFKRVHCFDNFEL